MASDVKFIRVHGRVVPVHSKGGNVSSQGHKFASAGSRSTSAKHYDSEAKKGFSAAQGNLTNAVVTGAIGALERKNVLGKVALGATAGLAILGTAQYAKAMSQHRMAKDIRKLKGRKK